MILLSSGSRILFGPRGWPLEPTEVYGGLFDQAGMTLSALTTICFGEKAQKKKQIS